MIKWFERHNKLSWTITILIAALIFYLSSFSFSGFGKVIYEANWRAIVYHVLIFFLLSIFLFISLLNGKQNNFLLFISFFVLVAYGVIDELHQSFVIGRFPSVLDLIFDSIGILFASMVYFIRLENKKLF